MADDKSWTPMPHRLVATVDRWGSVSLSIECPYPTDDHPERECRMGMEVRPECPVDERDTCGGWTAACGHVHYSPGCWVVEQMILDGMDVEEACSWFGDKPETLSLPADIWVEPGDEEAHSIGLWPPPVADRPTEGGDRG